MDFPNIHVHNVIPIRYRSRNNPWIDFVVIAAKDYETQVEKSIFEAIEAYWNGDYNNYADVVEDHLDGWSIPYMVMYRDSENMSPDYETQWTNIMNMIEVLTDKKIKYVSLF